MCPCYSEMDVLFGHKPNVTPIATYDLQEKDSLNGDDDVDVLLDKNDRLDSPLILDPFPNNDDDLVQVENLQDELVSTFKSDFYESHSPGQISRQSWAIDFTSHHVSRQRQLSHENVTQSPNPFQHYLQPLGNFTSLASASPTLSMLTHPHHPPDETPTLPPHLLPSQHAYNTAYHPCSHGGPSQHAPDTTYDPYACVVPSRHASDTAYPPYSRRVPSRHCLPSLFSCSAFLTCL
ncbi:hypothetical protein O181_128471 [Austropuccinia psidii MF-1]|uniref:Uncharacterized protein n=1 Tax=Austropuccinia psidii MF-1 TaxID=1389203 RepID=A0A9Q3Q7Q2_9BASI|nr:hypothetical protein [Austropuccinia psidii MF-1]